MNAILADITTLKVDAIVNAANRRLLGGGGVDGAIHRAAGPLLLRECESLGGCDTGSAKLTAGYNLPARYVIHAVGPVWRGGNFSEPEQLAGCYRSALELAIAHHCQSIAFPAISTGVYGYPPELAAQVAVSIVRSVLEAGNYIEVTFCCFSESDLNLYRNLLKS
jgi:O-acetyl-ADP-ribose deacetylase (regulator of RNase III)